MTKLNNFRDLSVTGSASGAGFQYEFYCAHCASTWRTRFQPYRRGQLAALLSGMALLLHGGQGGRATSSAERVASLGEHGAKTSSLEKAQEGAAERYRECSGCRAIVCVEDCWSEADDQCRDCVKHRDLAAKGRRGRDDDDDASGQGVGQAGTDAGPSCPNCSTAVGGGRFCPECGFDMASTHKTCPACGTLQKRASRFCTDCGHSF